MKSDTMSRRMTFSFPCSSVFIRGSKKTTEGCA
jgi:hypothetical protein